MKEPQAGEWWICKSTRVRVVGLHSDGDWVCEIESGALRVLPLGASWQHLPDCDSWDWQPEASPDPGEGWELLLKGTVLRKGDEVYMKGMTAYSWVETCYPGECVGSRPGLGALYRRKIVHPTICFMCGVNPAISGTAGCKDCTEFAIEATGCPLQPKATRTVTLTEWLVWDAEGYEHTRWDVQRPLAWNHAIEICKKTIEVPS